MSKIGLVHIYTGDGKGKTTASVGLAVRAAGAGKRVLFLQFLKGRPTGELVSLKKIGVSVVRSEAVTKFVPYMNEQELKECRQSQEAVFNEIKSRINSVDVVILDEVIGAISSGMISLGETIELIKSRPAGTEIVLTGRDAPQKLIEIADYVSEIKSVKHPYDKGITAREGIEY